MSQEKDCIGLNCPKELLNKTGLHNTMMFGIRGRGDHKLKWSDIQLLEDETGSEHLEFTERDTKTRTGEFEITHHWAFRPKQYSTLDDPSNCPVAAYTNKAFKDHRPASTMTLDSPF